MGQSDVQSTKDHSGWEEDEPGISSRKLGAQGGAGEISRVEMGTGDLRQWQRDREKWADERDTEGQMGRLTGLPVSPSWWLHSPRSGTLGDRSVRR